MSLTRSVLLAGSQNAWLRERAMQSPLVRRSVSRFMPGESLDDALRAAVAQQDAGLTTVLTRLGENVAEPSEAEQVVEHYLEALARIRAFGLEAQISVKPTQLGLDLSLETCFGHLVTLVGQAERSGNFVWIDMESTTYVDVTLDLFRRVRSRSSRIGVCLQAYLRRTADDLESLLPLGPAIRLVKGAYKESPTLAYPGKRKVDETYFDLASRLLEDDAQRAGATLAIATHDEALIERLRAVIRARAAAKPPQRDLAEAPVSAGAKAGGSTRHEFQMLYGIQRDLQRRLVDEGEPMRVLISYGDYWFPWYMRRLAERPANIWFVAKNLFAR